MLFVESYKNIDNLPEDVIIINTTSRSDNWTRGLSPFTVKAGHLYGNYYAVNVENGWQFAKVYEYFVDENNDPTPEYFKWAQRFWASSYAIRYPMGKGVKPLYSYWDGEKLDYIQARKKIYVPLYSRGVVQTDAFKKLSELYKTTDKDIYLIDFDGYNHKKLNMSMNDVLNCTTKKMGQVTVNKNINKS